MAQRLNMPDVTLKVLRKTGASLIRGHREHAAVDQLYLGHSPRSVADRHYSAAPDKLLANAVRWLGRHLRADQPQPVKKNKRKAKSAA